MAVLIHGVLLLGLAQGVMLWWQLWRLRALNAFGYSHLLVTLTAFMAVMLEQWLDYAGVWRQFPHLLRTTVWMPLLFGPGLWLYVQSFSRAHWRWRDAWHYLPALLGLLYTLPYLLQSAETKLALVYQTTAIPLESSVFGAIKAVSLLSYVGAVVWWLQRYRRTHRDRLITRLYRAGLAFLLFLLLLLATFVAEHVLGDLPLPSDMLAVVGLAVFLYATSLIAVAHWREFALSFAPAATIHDTTTQNTTTQNSSAPHTATQTTTAHNTPLATAPTISTSSATVTPVLATHAPPVTPAANADHAEPTTTHAEPPATATALPREALLAADTAAQIFQHVQAVVQARELFRRPGLRLDELSAEAQVPTHYLSYVINQCAGRNLQSWLNGLRVAAAKRELARVGDINVLDVGLAAGFNSKATFNRAFKQETGQTPSEFRQQQLSALQ